LLVQRICRYIEVHCEDSLTLTDLGGEFALSPYYLQRLFKRVTGVTPRQYIQAQRIERFKTHLKQGEPVTQALYDVGFTSSSRLYEQTPTRLGMTPARYKRGGVDIHIWYTIVSCPLGRLLIARTARGICSISLGEDDSELEDALRREYPEATRERNALELTHEVDAIVQNLHGSHPHLDLPLDVQATAFQQRVWSLLRIIPYGETRSYREVARELGDVNKARAVANACAQNPVALLVPCHRVVREDGSLGGYRWNIERKQQLLQQEHHVARQSTGTRE
jgi:AraC family transcriptional regulator of adaptative response/methylated-DNA-[protein]-cysteine methyltransferase